MKRSILTGYSFSREELTETVSVGAKPEDYSFLEKWREIEVKKLRNRIGGTIKAITER